MNDLLSFILSFSSNPSFCLPSLLDFFCLLFISALSAWPAELQLHSRVIHKQDLEKVPSPSLNHLDLFCLCMAGIVFVPVKVSQYFWPFPRYFLKYFVTIGSKCFGLTFLCFLFCLNLSSDVFRLVSEKGRGSWFLFNFQVLITCTKFIKIKKKHVTWGAGPLVIGHCPIGQSL